MPDEKLTAMSALSAMADADLLYAVDDPGGTPAEKQITAQVLKAYVGLPDFIHVREQEAVSVNGVTSSAATWEVRDLNTVMTNLITGASLATKQVTLPAGTYRVLAKAGAIDLDRHQLRLRNVTDGVTVANGTSELSNDSDYSMTNSTLWGRFTIAEEKDFELQHYTENAGGLLGNASQDAGEVEVYAELWIEREPQSAFVTVTPAPAETIASTVDPDVTGDLARTTVGLIYESDFSSDDRGDFTFSGSSTVTTSITGGRMRFSPPDNHAIIGVLTGISRGKTFGQMIQYYPSGNAASYSCIYLRHTDDSGVSLVGDGYRMLVNSNAQNCQLDEWTAASETTIDGPDAKTLNATTEYVGQLFVDDDLQEGWLDGLSQQGTDANHNGENARQIAVYGLRFAAGEPHIDLDDIIFMQDKTFIATGLDTGQKLKIFDSGDSEIFSATESSGTATIDASRHGGASVNVPIGGWAYATITDSGDSELTRFTPGIGGVYPGDVYEIIA